MSTATQNLNKTKENERTELHRAIWQIANDLRGSVDGWDFKQYVLGMLFYRFTSENLTNYINADERRAGKKDFDYAKLSNKEAEFGRADTVKEKLFYPDWIFKAKDKIWIIDTKKGATAELADTAYKAEALQEWLKGKKGLVGGITVQDGPNGWKLNSNAKYSYSTTLKGWTALQDLLN